MEYSQEDDALHQQHSTIVCHWSAALGARGFRLWGIPIVDHPFDGEGTGVLHFADGPTEIRTRVSAVRGQRPWPLDDGALPLQQFRGRDSNPDSTVQSRMSCLLDDPGVIVVE